MKKHISVLKSFSVVGLVLLLLGSTGIANASRMFRVLEEEEITQADIDNDYSETDELEDEIEDLKAEIQSLKREIASRPAVRYVEKPVIKPVVIRERPVIRRRIIYTRPVCYTPVSRVVYHHDSCGSSFASGLIDFGVGAAIGAACSR